MILFVWFWGHPSSAQDFLLAPGGLGGPGGMPENELESAEHRVGGLLAGALLGPIEATF